MAAKKPSTVTHYPMVHIGERLANQWHSAVPAHWELSEYDRWGSDQQGVDEPGELEWNPIDQPFEATLRFYEVFRGRSATHFRVEDVSNGNRYPIALKHMGWLVKNLTVQDAQVTGTWKVIKRGAYYSLMHVDDPNTEEVKNW